MQNPVDGMIAEAANAVVEDQAAVFDVCHGQSSVKLSQVLCGADGMLAAGGRFQQFEAAESVVSAALFLAFFRETKKRQAEPAV